MLKKALGDTLKNHVLTIQCVYSSHVLAKTHCNSFPQQEQELNALRQSWMQKFNSLAADLWRENERLLKSSTLLQETRLVQDQTKHFWGPNVLLDLFFVSRSSQY